MFWTNKHTNNQTNSYFINIDNGRNTCNVYLSVVKHICDHIIIYINLQYYDLYIILAQCLNQKKPKKSLYFVSAKNHTSYKMRSLNRTTFQSNQTICLPAFHYSLHCSHHKEMPQFLLLNLIEQQPRLELMNPMLPHFFKHS